jgi:hypothetical protein
MIRVTVVAHLRYMLLFFKNSYPTAEELVCSAFSEERVFNSCATCILSTISHRITQPSIIVSLVQEIRAERVNLQSESTWVGRIGLWPRHLPCDLRNTYRVSARCVLNFERFQSTGVGVKFQVRRFRFLYFEIVKLFCDHPVYQYGATEWRQGETEELG